MKDVTELDRRLDAEDAREEVWRAIAEVARPDARFHCDYASFIPDFHGSDALAWRLCALPAYQDGRLLFVTPDNSLEQFRRLLLARGRQFVMTTHGIRRGFHLVDGASVAPEDVKHAATLDGFEHYSTPLKLSDLPALGGIGLLITGSSAIATNGIRFGKGHGYFDLEWAMLAEIGALAAQPMVVAVGHDRQVVDVPLLPEEHDVPVDLIVTPTRTIVVRDRPRRPSSVLWQLLPDERVDAIPPLAELRELQGGRS